MIYVIARQENKKLLESYNMKNYISLSHAAKSDSDHLTYNALWRWCRRGIKTRSGQTVKLHHKRIGGQIFTTAEALNEFLGILAQEDSTYFGTS